MKKSRKGFTLIELLIVITILGSLAAAMSNSSGDATARAKASSIVANVEACKTAAAIYYSDNWEGTDVADATAKTFLEDTDKYIPNFGDFSTGNITFKANATDSDKGRDNWSITVNFESDAEAANVAKALVKAKGYAKLYTAATEAVGNVGDDDYQAAAPESFAKEFKVNLTTGKITVE